MDPIKVKMTRDHIRDGKQGDYHFCPVALAIRDAGSKSMCAVDVTTNRILAYDREVARRVRASVPSEVADFIRDFDSGKSPEPIAFDLYFDDRNQRKGKGELQ